MKLYKNEIRAIQNNLVSIGVVTSFYDFEYNKITLQINKNGVRMYCTILTMLGKSTLFNCPKYSQEYIKSNTLNSMKDLILEQKFIDFIPLSDNIYMLTKRGMEHIIVMFDLNFNKHPYEWLVRINRLFRFGLKG